MIPKIDNGITGAHTGRAALQGTVMTRHLPEAAQDLANPPRRALNDAMNIARLSQTVLQKAMMISSRLQNIATEAMTTGTVRDAELSSILADMNATLDRFGENIAPSTEVGIQQAGRSVPEDLARAKEMTASLMKKISQGGDTTGMTGEISRTAVQAEKAILTVASNDRINPDTLLRSTSAAILNDPDGALASQAQVSRIAAERLTGAI